MAIAQVWKSSKSRLNAVKARSLNPRVLQLFEMTKVDKFFPRVATVEEADRF